jgi:hypothetical protein
MSGKFDISNGHLLISLKQFKYQLFFQVLSTSLKLPLYFIIIASVMTSFIILQFVLRKNILFLLSSIVYVKNSGCPRF